MANIARRSFLKAATTATAASYALGSGTVHVMAQAQGEPQATRSANEKIQIALIGAGGQGQYDTRIALETGEARVVAVADCYDGRRAHTQELWGNQVFTTRDYREVLSRPDVEAVIVATPDHWHKQIAIDAMNAGKDVYLEKPMIHAIPEGPEMIAAAQRTGRVIQIGSQRVSSVIYRKAKELLAAGAIGKLNMVTAWWDRNSAIGAWEYSIPTDASPETIAWDRFLGDAPHIPFNAAHFFRWRCWRAYGTGVAGDLFVHLFSGTHFITGVEGPTRAYATGGLRYWNDGRDVPDVLLGLFDYPEGFNLSLRVNFVNGGSESEGLIFTGSEGTMQIAGDGVALIRVPRERAPGYTIDTFSDSEQKAFLAEYLKQYPPVHPVGTINDLQQKYIPPEGYNDSYEHLLNFFNAVRTRNAVVEDAVFGYRAAGAALLSNASYFEKRIVNWDPVKMALA
jgi:predicted dehydrogenase